MNIKNAWQSLFILAVSACTVQIPDVKVCAVAGVMAAGADCAYTLSDTVEEMTLEQFLEFLEPQPERPDPSDPTKTLPARGPALCQSTDDYTRVKIALEQACKKLGTSCSKEVKEGIKAVSTRVSRLQARVGEKAKLKVHPILKPN